MPKPWKLKKNLIPFGEERNLETNILVLGVFIFLLQFLGPLSRWSQENKYIFYIIIYMY